MVIDTGIATDDNIAMLKNKEYDYMCVSRSSLKEYHTDTTALPVEIKDKKDQPIELLKVKTNGDNDQYLWVRSQARALKKIYDLLKYIYMLLLWEKIRCLPAEFFLNYNS